MCLNLWRSVVERVAPCLTDPQGSHWPLRARAHDHDLVTCPTDWRNLGLKNGFSVSVCCIGFDTHNYTLRSPMYYCLFCDVYLTLTFLLYQPDALHVRLVVFNWLVDWLFAYTFILTCTFLYIVCAVTLCRFLLTLNGSHFVIYSALLLQILIISVFIFQIRDIY